MSKKVLMITYPYPPIWGMGTIRSWKFATYLPKFGWRPVILTVRADAPAWEEKTGPEIAVVRTKYINIKKTIDCLLRRGRNDRNEYRHSGLFETREKSGFSIRSSLKKMAQDLIFFPDDRIGWYPFGVKEGFRAMKEFNVKAIYSTSSPVTSHMIAHTLKHKTGLPWVADLRDLWTQNPYYRKLRVVSWLEGILEKHILSTADALVTVSEPLAAQLSQKHPRFSRKIQVITNGFDPDDFQGTVLKRPEKFTITHTGQLYHLKRNPEPLLAALAELQGDGLIRLEDVELRFVGDSNPDLTKLAAKYNMQKNLTVTGPVPYQEALALQQQSSILLVMVNDDETSCRGELTGKIFEYLGAGRQILALVPPGNVIEKLLQETGAGAALSPNNIPALKKNLLCWFREYKESGEPAYSPNREEIRQYTRENTTRNLASLFDDLLVRTI